MKPIFSDLARRYKTTLNALYQERSARRGQGLRVIDLVSANVNQAGFFFPPALLDAALRRGARQARIYTPDPLGRSIAREAVRRHYLKERLDVAADHILITPGTSVSYWYLFKLLTNTGDQVLCPQPSYPLLDSIAELCGIRLAPYRLLERRRWEIDLNHLQSHINSKTRAIVIITPHNPTGAVASEAELAGLAVIASRHHLPIISDEVFSAFLFTRERLPRIASRTLPLVFTLNGVSKMLALPGLKIGWIAINGDPALVKKAVHALDIISDTFLPVNEPVQFALPVLLEEGGPFLARFQREIRLRAQIMIQQVKGTLGLTLIPPEGGFYMTIRLPPNSDEEKVTLSLLKNEGILLHPGYFYDMAGAHLVFSFVSPTKLLQSALTKLAGYFKRRDGPKAGM